jgi:glycosyltransferase involved in cell wall biosynthesis
VVILTNQPSPYRVPFFNELARRCDLLVLFDEHVEPGREWVVKEDSLLFPYAFLRGFRFSRTRMHPGPEPGYKEKRALQLRFDIIPHLYRFKPQVVVSAELGPRSLQASLFCSMTRTPLILWWEGTPHTEGFVSGWKAELRRVLCRKAARLWSNGAESAELLRHYGASACAIDNHMAGADTEQLYSQVRKLLPFRESLRRKFGLRGVTLLFVGRYTGRKGIYKYLDALRRLYAQIPQGWTALFVGSGPGAEAIRSTIRAHPGIPLVDAGYIQQENLAEIWAASDLFVLPTIDDNWSLVALEAAVAGLPQLCSIYNGCLPEILIDKHCGVAFDPLDEELERLLVESIRKPLNRIPSEIANELVSRYSSRSLAIRAEQSISAAIQ